MPSGLQRACDRRKPARRPPLFKLPGFVAVLHRSGNSPLTTQVWLERETASSEQQSTSVAILRNTRMSTAASTKKRDSRSAYTQAVSRCHLRQNGV